MVTFPMTLSDP